MSQKTFEFLDPYLKALDPRKLLKKDVGWLHGKSKDEDEATRLHFTLDITAGTLEVQVDFGEPVLLLGPGPGAVHTTNAITTGNSLFAGARINICFYCFIKQLCRR